MTNGVTMDNITKLKAAVGMCCGTTADKREIKDLIAEIEAERSAAQGTLQDALAQALAWDRNRDEPNQQDKDDAEQAVIRWNKRRVELGLKPWG